MNGRHPLLLAGAEPVVPFDLEMAPDERTLLISGPNTGGKTVLLKAVGLASALAQSGIVPPVGPGTRLPAFGGYFADIGDRQSISASLSTFSAHVAMLRRVLADADAGALVLLDEVGSGTDPAEGAALAAAILASLTARGTLTLATTHLGALKDLASHTPGVVNASLQFDAATLTPTYRFVKGVPGRSYGLAIARRLGIAAEVLADAEARVPDAERNLDALLAAVEERGREVRETQSRLDQRDAELESLAARLTTQEESQAAREAELKRREKDADRAGRAAGEAVPAWMRGSLVEEALGAARAAGRRRGARSAEHGRGGNPGGAGERLGQPDSGSAAAVGGWPAAGVVKSRVRLPTGGTGEVLELRARRDRGRRGGGDEGRARRTRLTAPAAAHPVPRPRCPAVGRPATRRPPPLELDLRGLTGDEAEQATIAAVDAAVLAEQPFLRIIHGMGTGVVRDRVRRVVSGDRRVTRYRVRAPQPGRHRRHHRGVLGMSMIPDETVDQVRESADLVGLIGEAVELKRTGSDYRGPCPFHGGTHRNFAVIPKKNRYYCFVCHESGDVFSWLMKRFGMDYPTAVREAAPPGGNRHPRRPVARGPRPAGAALRGGGGGPGLVHPPAPGVPRWGGRARDYLDGPRDLPGGRRPARPRASRPRGAAFSRR